MLFLLAKGNFIIFCQRLATNALCEKSCLIFSHIISRCKYHVSFRYILYRILLCEFHFQAWIIACVICRLSSSSSSVNCRQRQPWCRDYDESCMFSMNSKQSPWLSLITLKCSYAWSMRGRRKFLEFFNMCKMSVSIYMYLYILVQYSIECYSFSVRVSINVYFI